MSARAAHSRGFTLVELMVTLTIFAILAGFAVPSFRTFVANQKVKSASSELMTTVLLARSEAIKRNATVRMTPEADDWKKGWNVAAGATTIASQSEFANLTITQKDESKNPISATPIDFGSNGRPTAGAYFEITGESDSVKCVKLDKTGIPTSTKGSCPT